MTISQQFTDERGTYTLILADQPGPCGTCRRMTMWFVQREGRTHCGNCDVMEGMNGKAADPTGCSQAAAGDGRDDSKVAPASEAPVRAAGAQGDSNYRRGPGALRSKPQGGSV